MDPFYYYAACSFLLRILATRHVWHQCRRIGEPPLFNAGATFIFFPFFYLSWIFWWPGCLRRNIDDLPTAWAFRRANGIPKPE